MVSPRKSKSALSLIPEEQQQNCRMERSQTKSCESLYSNATTSSKNSAVSAVYRRKNHQMSNGGGMAVGAGGLGGRQASIIPATNEVRQRVLSARRLRMKTYQNQLADAQQTIAELAHENRILRTLHKRQDTALSKYESTNAELPQLLHSHAEELRVWQAKYRNLQAQHKDLEAKMKQKEAVILSLSDQNKYYSQLNKDKNLEERQRLTDKMHMMEQRLQEKDNDLKLMARKMQLEGKNFRQQLQNEQRRTKDVLIRLEKSRLELSGYHKLEEINLSDKLTRFSLRRKSTENDEDSQPKLEKDLEKTNLEAHEHEDSNDNSLVDVEDQLATGRTSRSLAQNMPSSSRNIRKLNAVNTSKLPSNTSPQPQIGGPIPLKGGGGIGVGSTRLDRGDGDASIISELKKTTSNVTFNKMSSYEDDYEEDEVDDVTAREELKAVMAREGRFLVKRAPLQETDTDDKEGDEEPDDDEDADADDDADDYDNDKKVAINSGIGGGGAPTTDDTDADDVILNTSTRMKEEISSIRKQISNDYKEREAFLDTFCRQATGNSLREESPQKRNSIAMGSTNVPNNRKHKLLAALKAIDADKSQD